MRRWAKPSVRRTRPIGGIMAGMKARAAEVGDLVVIEAGGGERLVRMEELRLVAFVGRLQQLAACLPSPHRSVGLDRETVQRQMRRLELERSRDVDRPGAFDTLGQREDQI